MSRELMNGTKILLAAHRGNKACFPENTMVAMRSAVEMGCDMIETDIHMTKDGYLVLLHDRDVKRTTNGEGNVDEMLLEDVCSLDAGSWMDEEFAGEQIPLVEEFLEYISKTDLLVNWEFKDYPTIVGDEHAFRCVDKCVELIDKYDMAERSMVNSFSERVLEYIDNNWPGKFVIHGQGIHTCSKRKDIPDRAPETFFDWVCMYNKTPEHPAGIKEDYDYAISHNIIPCICFEDNLENYKLALELGARMFTSNEPQRGIEILKELGVRD